jgi:prophage maintenance system killer protein
VAIARAELGDDAVPDLGRVAEAVTVLSRRDDDGREAHPGVVPKAAALLLAMLRLRPFARGNARVALLATTVFLNRNGLDLEGDDDGLLACMAVAASGELSVLETASALERFVVRLVRPVG